MGPKQKKKDNSMTELKLTTGELEAPPPPPPDPYLELRFTPLPVDAQQRASTRPALKHTRALVLKKKRLPQQLPPSAQIQINNKDSNETTKSTESKGTELFAPGEMFSKFNFKGRDDTNPGILNTGASNPRALVKWFSPGELPLEPPPLAVLRRPTQPNSAYQHSLQDSLRKEFALLTTFDMRKRQELAMEDLLMQKTGKARPNLLLRRQQHLPHVDGEGQEISRFRVERTETPEIVYDNDIVCEAASKVREIHGLRRTLTRRERGYSVIQDWVGCPEVTDYILRELDHRGEAHLPTKSDGRETGVSYQDGEFVPMVEELGVVGLEYERAQLRLKEMQRTEQNKCQQKPKFLGENLASSQQWTTGISEQVQHDYTNPNQPGQQQSLPAIRFGQVTLCWSLDPDRAKKTWVVELGCTAEIGHNAMASITMSNIGTTAVHFMWKKVESANVFQLKRRSLRRFVFDCWGGTFLPGETFRVPVLYKGLEPGFFSEDWLLQTQPVLENGAPIITRLWGITRLCDPFRLARLDLDDSLASRCAQTIAEHQVKKLVDHLTLNEVPLKDTRFPLVLLGPDLFHLNNPWLKYHCASVYRLGKLFTMTENKRVPTLNMDNLVDKTSLYIFTESNSITEELHSASKLTVNSVPMPTQDQLLTPNQSVFNEQSIGLKSEEGSVFSDEEVVGSSIGHIKRLILEQINPDTPLLGPVETDPIEDDILDDDDGGSGGTTAGRRKRPLAINLTNVDFSVDQMRENILGNVVDSQEHREAQFQIMSEQVARLLFRTDMPLDIWKTVVARGLLCTALDSFADFAQSLKEKCCEGQILYNDAEDKKMSPDPSNSMTEEDEDEMGGDEENEGEMLEVAKEVLVVDNEKSTSRSHESSETSSESLTPIPCSKAAPKQALIDLRYTDQYISRLYCRMYHLLTDYFDSLYVLLSEVRKLKISQDEVGFTRIREIPMNLSIEDMLNAPLPPSWVLLAQRMDDTVQRVQARKEQLLKESAALAT